MPKWSMRYSRDEDGRTVALCPYCDEKGIYPTMSEALEGGLKHVGWCRGVHGDA